jgi:hypothetical protein
MFVTMKREKIRPSKKEMNKAVTMLILRITLQWCGLYGAVVNVLDTGPKGCAFEAGQGDGFLRAIQILCTPSSRMGSKAGRSHVVRICGM